MKLWIDECLSPTLVERASRRGYWATPNRDRSLLGLHTGLLILPQAGRREALVERGSELLGFVAATLSIRSLSTMSIEMSTLYPR